MFVYYSNSCKLFLRENHFYSQIKLICWATKNVFSLIIMVLVGGKKTNEFQSKMCWQGDKLLISRAHATHGVSRCGESPEVWKNISGSAQQTQNIL